MRITHSIIPALLFAAVLALVGCVSEQQKQQLQTGYNALQQKQYQQAISAADQYLARTPRGPGSPEAVYLRGRAIEQRPKATPSQALADLREAQNLYIRALELSPSQPLASYIRASFGNTAYYQDDYATALQQFELAERGLDRTDLKAWVAYLRGVCLQRLGRFGEADDTFAQVQKDFPGTAAAQQARTHTGAREFYVQAGAFQSPQSADTLIATLRARGVSARRVLKLDRQLHVVLAGPYRTYNQAANARSVVASVAPDAMIIP